MTRNQETRTSVPIIGHAGTYYTLWTKREIKTTGTTTTHYQYHKNIAISIEKIKELYQGVEIDHTLKGRKKSFSVHTQTEKDPGKIRFGKYAGKRIEEIAKTDFRYILWLHGTAGTQTRELIEQLQEYQEFVSGREKERQEIINSLPRINPGEEITALIKTNIKKQIMMKDGTPYEIGCLEGEYQGHCITIEGLEGKSIFGKYPHTLPVIDGKATRAKNKWMTFKVDRVKEPTQQYGIGWNHILVHGWKKNIKETD